MPEINNIFRISSVDPEPHIIQKAGEVLCQKGVVIFPAKCLYGVAVDALSSEAIEKVFRLKQRPDTNPILVLVKDQAMLKGLVTAVPASAGLLMNLFWPGNLTLVFNARDHIPDALTAGTGKIGIRIPSHPVARALVNHTDFPITGTSANLSGHAGCSQVEQLPASFMSDSDLILDAGAVKGGKGSTIVDVTTGDNRIIREGEISTSQIKAALADL